MSPGSRRVEQEGRKDGITALGTAVNTGSALRSPPWTTPQSCPFEGREAGAFVLQLSSLLAGDCLPEWDPPEGRPSSLLDSGVNPEAEQQRDTEARTCGGAASMQVTIHHRGTRVTGRPQGSDTRHRVRLLLPFPTSLPLASCSISC